MSAVDSTSNSPALSVSDLAFALKRTLEDAFGHVRLRGEISKVTRHSSGHVYLSLKDERAVIDAVVWKGQVRGLQVQPEQGLEVIVTGRITTYPARSSYQLIIETMEPAGVGALLAQLERLKAKLAGEGLFETSRKRPLPVMPQVIGVVTSPTGAVIRDILHRITDRWPCRVVVWPVVVQGETAAAQVSAAIRGFETLTPGGPIPRPDLLIVARGGGSIEDLWPFNDEALARAVAACTIPLISAVGHETDTTLIDFVSDRRAPTPTAAAEMATPELAELKLQLIGMDQRLTRSMSQTLDGLHTRVTAAGRGLPRPADLLGLAAQRFDHAAARLSGALGRNIELHARDLTRWSSRLTPVLLERPGRLKADRLSELSQRLAGAARRKAADAEARARLPSLQQRLDAAMGRRIQLAAGEVARLDQLRRSLDPNGPLTRGFARVHLADGKLVRSATSLSAGDGVKLVFADGDRTAVVQDGEPPAARAAPKRAEPVKKPPTGGLSQGDLF
jgi:exodeoxyribonuclease VII large subunit